MKRLFFILICINSLGGSAQALDTIFVNEHNNVALFFPQRIRQAVVGAENFVFSYNQEHPQFFGLLKGTAGKNSNLLAITQDGEIYSYILKYAENLPQINYFLGKESSVGNEQREIENKKTRKELIQLFQKIVYIKEMNLKNLQLTTATIPPEN